MALGGVPQGDSVLITKDGLSQLELYLATEREWIEAASVCLGIGQ